MEDKVKTAKHRSPYWHQVSLINLFEKYLLKSQSLGWVVLHAAKRVVRGLQGFCERGAGEGGGHCHHQHDHLRQPHQNNSHHNLSSTTIANDIIITNTVTITLAMHHHHYYHIVHQFLS